MLRQPAVAGQFYPADPGQLEQMVSGMLEVSPRPEEALVAVSPHAGYIYSGSVAGKVLGRVVVPPRVVVAGVNHQGLGSAAAVMGNGSWAMPLGEVPLDQALAADLLARCPLINEDPLAHQYEHSLEVQVPFLQVRQPDLRLTPLSLGHLSFEECVQVAQALAGAIAAAGEPVLMVASTDMTHYETAAEAQAKDQMAIDRMLALDPRGLYETVRGQGITMCGVLPTAVCLLAALELGASRAELVDYRHSGLVSGDNHQVVGYAGLIVM